MTPLIKKDCMEKVFEIFVTNIHKAKALLCCLAHEGCVVSLEKKGRMNYVVVWNEKQKN